MATRVTQYKLLVSCPSDVNKELNYIKDAVELFNKTCGEMNSVKLEMCHWATDSYPESGGRPQDLLNKQLIASCDAAIAVFGTRFGTPTGEYDSGTEEEVEELLNSGKQVFLYFSNCPIEPTAIDAEQYKKVSAFRAKYADKGIYSTYSNLDIFRKNIFNHLSLYFLQVITTGSNLDGQPIKSNLCLKGVVDGKFAEVPVVIKRNYLNSKYMNEQKTAIIDMISKVKSTSLPVKPVASIEPTKDILPNYNGTATAIFSMNKKLAAMTRIFPEEDAKISIQSGKIINDFVIKNAIEIADDFFFLGELKILENLPAVFSAQSESLMGNDEEKRKYTLLKQLQFKVEEYSQLEDYFAQIDARTYISLALCNLGTNYDEDVDVKIFIPSGHMCSLQCLPVPGDYILDIAIRTVELIYKDSKSVSIDEYSNYPFRPTIPEIPNMGIPGLYYNNNNDIEDQRRKFRHNCEDVFCYEFFSEDGNDVVCFNQSYLKQNTCCLLPSYLVFHSAPEAIKYEIKSKHCADIVKGELRIINSQDVV